MTRVPLAEFVTGRLNSSGAGTLQVGPRGHGVLWQPAIASIRMSGSIPTGLATCYLYVGSTATDNNFVDATYDVTSAASDSVQGSRVLLGQYVWAVWTGGNANAIVTLTVNGTQEVP